MFSESEVLYNSINSEFEALGLNITSVIVTSGSVWDVVIVESATSNEKVILLIPVFEVQFEIT